MTLTLDQRQEIVQKIQALRNDMEELNQRAAGLAYTPKHLRAERNEELKALFEAKQKEEMDLMQQLRSPDPAPAA
jgi:hypothetical protein